MPTHNADAAEPKNCPRCHTMKTRGDFPRDKSRPDGRYSWCKPCNAANVRSRYDREAQRVWQAGYRNTERGKLSANAARIKHLYGLTPEQVEAMTIVQAGACAICGRTDQKLHIDHCHDRGTVRGLLCVGCNHGIGHLGDDPDRMLAAAAYLLASVEVVRGY